MTITREASGTKSGGGTGAVSVPIDSITSGYMALIGRCVWNSDGTASNETGWTNTVDLTGGTGTAVDSHTSRIRVDRRILNATETSPLGMNQGGTVSGALGVCVEYSHGGGGWDTVASTSGTDDTHGTGRSVTGSGTIAFQAGDVLVCFIAVDTDATTSWSAKTLAASGITFGGGTTTVHDSTSGGVLTGNDGNIMVLEAVVTSGSGTVAPTLTLTGGPSQCGPVAFIRLREIPLTSVSSDVDLRWSSAAQITNDVDLRWRSAVEVSSDADLRWRSYVSLTNDVDLRWRSYVSITSDVDLRWRSSVQVTSDVDLRWRSYVVVTSDVDARWRVYQPVESDVDARWRVFVPITQDADLRWRTRVLVASDVDVRWRSYVAVSSDVDLRWVVDSALVSVSSDVDVRWRVYVGVSADLDVRWLVYVPVTSDMDLRWRSAIEVESDVDLRWRVDGGAQQVSSLLDLRWIVAGVPGVADIIVTLGIPTIVVNLTELDAVADLTPAGATIVMVDTGQAIVNLDAPTVEAPL